MFLFLLLYVEMRRKKNATLALPALLTCNWWNWRRVCVNSRERVNAEAFVNFEWLGIERPRKGVPRRNSFLTIRDKLPVYNYRANVRNRRSYSSVRRQLVFHELDSRYIACTYIIYEIVTGASFTRRALDSGENSRDFDDRVARSRHKRGD